MATRQLYCGQPDKQTLCLNKKLSEQLGTGGALPEEVPNTFSQTNHDAMVINYNPYSGHLIEFNGSHKWMENNGQVSTQVIQPSTSAEAATQEHQASTARSSDSFQRCRKARFYVKSSHFYTLASNSHF